MTKSTTLLLALLALALPVASQQAMTIGQCRERALNGNRALKQAEMKMEQTEALQGVALAQMLPKVSANGGYFWMQRSVNLLSDEQRERITSMGDNVEADIDAQLHRQLADLPIGGDLLADRLSGAVSASGLGERLNGVGQDIADGLTTDTRNVGFAVATVSQPLYMGGKLLAAYRTARLANELSGVEYSRDREATLVAVDEAYWQVVSVQHKVRLARQYAELLDTLESHVQLSVEADVATRGDLARVRVKRNEAQLSLTKAENGLRLARMLLAERCGMPLDTVFEVYEGELQLASQPYTAAAPTAQQMQEVYARRAETRMLGIADSIAREGVRIAASTLKPNVVLTGGYLVSNPNVFDGFSNSWGGTWMAGVAVNVPIAHPGGIYAVKAAKAKRHEAEQKRLEAEELIELQVNKLACELELSYKHLAEAEAGVEYANENMRLADESYAAGLCSSSDVMAAQAAWLQAAGEAVDARIEIEMGRVYLNQALGK